MKGSSPESAKISKKGKIRWTPRSKDEGKNEFKAEIEYKQNGKVKVKTFKFTVRVYKGQTVGEKTIKPNKGGKLVVFVPTDTDVDAEVKVEIPPNAIENKAVLKIKSLPLNKVMTTVGEEKFINHFAWTHKKRVASVHFDISIGGERLLKAAKVSIRFPGDFEISTKEYAVDHLKAASGGSAWVPVRSLLSSYAGGSELGIDFETNSFSPFVLVKKYQDYIRREGEIDAGFQSRRMAYESLIPRTDQLSCFLEQNTNEIEDYTFYYIPEKELRKSQWCNVQDGEDDFHILGCEVSGTNRIVINQDLKDPELSKSTVLHESIHALNRKKYQPDPDWTNSMKLFFEEYTAFLTQTLISQDFPGEGAAQLSLYKKLLAAYNNGNFFDKFIELTDGVYEWSKILSEDEIDELKSKEQSELFNWVQSLLSCGIRGFVYEFDPEAEENIPSAGAFVEAYISSPWLGSTSQVTQTNDRGFYSFDIYDRKFTQATVKASKGEYEPVEVQHQISGITGANDFVEDIILGLEQCKGIRVFLESGVEPCRTTDDYDGPFCEFKNTGLSFAYFIKI